MASNEECEEPRQERLRRRKEQDRIPKQSETPDERCEVSYIRTCTRTELVLAIQCLDCWAVGAESGMIVI